MKDNVSQRAGGDVRLLEYAPLPAISAAGEPTDHTGMRWTAGLVWFMRTMAVVWIAKGLFAWTIVLGVNSAATDFLDLTSPLKAMTGFFAVADLLAAVGLWLAAPWGGVLWLVCAATEIMAAAFGGGATLTSATGVVLESALIVIYFAASWLAANERA
jgi:hypothetical protein